jgi:hypothetical protein
LEIETVLKDSGRQNYSMTQLIKEIPIKYFKRVSNNTLTNHHSPGRAISRTHFPIIKGFVQQLIKNHVLKTRKILRLAKKYILKITSLILKFLF